ncbi:MAG: sensor histidine kinase [Atopobiaceae bacterium]|nr:sensor histidine kinase [Atopobiaceae bacterium]
MGKSPDDLMSFVSRMGGDRQLRVEENLGAGFVRLRVAEAERRQAKHDIRSIEDAVIEMLRNARDAGARHIYVATSREGTVRTTTILDDGVGIPPSMHERIFDARVTSKLDTMKMDRWGVHGRGMALFAIRENTESASVLSSDTGKGAAIQLVSDANRLSERSDQSTWPNMGTDDEGQPSIVKGPRNIVRTCCEFCLEEHGSCEVYLGSPADIVATARRRVRPTLSHTDLLFLDDLDDLPVLERLSAAADAGELSQVAHGVGLTISERTAHRIVSGEIRPMRSVWSRMTHASQAQDAHVDLMRDRRGLRISEKDAEDFLRLMERDFSLLGERYYLTLAQDPKLRYSRGRLTVIFDVMESD